MTALNWAMIRTVCKIHSGTGLCPPALRPAERIPGWRRHPCSQFLSTTITFFYKAHTFLLSSIREDFLLFFVQCAAHSDILLVFIEIKGRIFISNSRLDASGCQWGHFFPRSCCIVCLRPISAGLLGTLYQPDTELLMHWPCIFKYL